MFCCWGVDRVGCGDDGGDEGCVAGCGCCGEAGYAVAACEFVGEEQHCAAGEDHEQAKGDAEQSGFDDGVEVDGQAEGQARTTLDSGRSQRIP